MAYQLTLYDAQNWARGEFETGHSMRQCIDHIVHSPAPTIVVWDGKDSRKLRKRVFSGYKSKRPPLTEDLRQQFELLEALVKLSPVTSIKVDGYEADDVIAHLAEEWNVGPVMVYSTDRDLLQLSNVKLDGDNKIKCERRYLRLFKTLVGDPSDCIPGIPGFGEKTFNEAINPERALNLEAWFESVEDSGSLQLGADLRAIAPKRCQNWLSDEKNLGLLRDYWKIIGFLPVPERKLNAGTSLGKNRLDVIDEILQGVLQ